MKRALTLFFLWLGTLNGWAQTPSPAQVGLVVATPNVVQVLDSSKNWATIGTINPTTHAFSVGGLPPLVTSFNTRTGAVTLNSTDVTTALGFTPLSIPYVLPTASTSVLGGVKVDGSTININGSGVISGTPPAITANSTPTSGFAANQLMLSDGAKVQSAAPGVVGSLGILSLDAGNPVYSNYIRSWSNGFNFAMRFNSASSRYDFDNATSPSLLRVFNTFSDTNNGEWGALDWQTTANTLTIGSQANGTGTQRPVNIVGNPVTINGGAVDTITRNSTLTSGYAAGNMLISDGTKVQASIAQDRGNTIYVPFITIGGEYNYLTTSGANGGPAGYDFFTSSGQMNLRTAGSAGSIFRAFNAFSDYNNSEWGGFDWVTVPNTLTLGTQKNGTGTLRPMNLVASNLQINGTAAVSCAAGTVSLTTLVVTNGIITHC